MQLPPVLYEEQPRPLQVPPAPLGGPGCQAHLAGNGLNPQKGLAGVLVGVLGNKGEEFTPGVLPPGVWKKLIPGQLFNPFLPLLRPRAPGRGGESREGGVLLGARGECGGIGHRGRLCGRRLGDMLIKHR